MSSALDYDDEYSPPVTRRGRVVTDDADELLPPRESKTRGAVFMIAAYAFALLPAVGICYAAWDDDSYDPLVVALVADAAATTFIFFFSVLLDNSSMYDPYWSVAPVPIVIYFAMHPLCASMIDYVGPTSVIRLVVVMGLVLTWAGRLTYNFYVRWEGLLHEDWRYVDLRQQTGMAYWVVSYLGIHMMPTLLVYGGCVSLYVVFCAANAPLNLLDVVAAATTGAAIFIEATADAQLRRFVAKGKAKPGDVLCTGLWQYSRHPNYFGEVLFWWGLFFFAVAAGIPRSLFSFTLAGPVAITGLFVFISVPLVERRMIARRPAFAAYVKRTSALFPWFPRRASN